MDGMGINPLSLMLQCAPFASGFGLSFGCLKTFSKGIWSTRAPNTKKFDSLRRSLDLQTGHSKHSKDRKSMTGRQRINLNPQSHITITTWEKILPILNPSECFFGGEPWGNPCRVVFLSELRRALGLDMFVCIFVTLISNFKNFMVIHRPYGAKCISIWQGSWNSPISGRSNLMQIY